MTHHRRETNRNKEDDTAHSALWERRVCVTGERSGGYGSIFSRRPFRGEEGARRAVYQRPPPPRDLDTPDPGVGHGFVQHERSDSDA